MNIRRCGCDVVVGQERKFIRLLNVDAHTKILSTSSKTTLTQTYENPSSTNPLEELRYVFPLFEGVSVVAFAAHVGSRVVKGVVEENSTAKQAYNEAKDRGEVAGLLEQSRQAGDVFVTTVGNVPAGETIVVKIEYLADLKHDTETDAIRFTIPTSIAPRYYGSSGLLQSDHTPVTKVKEGFSVTIDVEMPKGSAIESVQSPSHPINVQIGTLSTSAAKDEPSLSKASASLSLGTSELAADFVLQIGATKVGEPSAMLETHPDIPNQRAIMTTLVPKFNIPAEKPEIVFLCDRSGSMGGQQKIPKLQEALNVFLKSLPVGVKFNLVSFGGHYEFLWERSETYDQNTLDKALAYVDTFGSDFGGTEMYSPLDQVFKQRYTDMNLEVFLLTDGEIWNQQALFDLINKEVTVSKGATRLFSVGIGQDASSSLIEGVARAGNGFAQSVGDNEQATTKILRMLKASLHPHILDYSLELKYQSTDSDTETEDFEIVEKVDAKRSVEVPGQANKESKKPISLYDPSGSAEADEAASTAPGSKYSHLPNVATPCYIQSPHRIPALFPFNRTTVYVLLSDAKPGYLPNSLLLKGSSSYGPVELEIPITNLANESKTIHQLAARSTVRELEEGRGWMSQASDPASGQALKDKYFGRFPDMVEHEAVKLGVKYQITGKWTSFVAVEENSSAEGLSETIGMANRGVALVSGFPSRGSGLIRGGGSGFAAKTGASSKKIRKMVATASHSPRVEGDVRSARSARSVHVGQPGQLARKAPRKSAPTMDVVSQSVPEEDSDEEMGFAYFSSGEQSADDGSDDAVGYRLIDSRGPSQPAPAPAPAPSLSPLQRLINLQKFDGRWTWTEELADVLGLQEQEVIKVAHDAGAQAQNVDILATVSAILYMQLKVADEKDIWGMLVSKAETWVKDQQGADGYQALRQAIGGRFRA